MPEDSVEARLVSQRKYVKRLVAAIDMAVSTQLTGILRHSEFQELEGAWRGLYHLVTNSESLPSLKIRVPMRLVDARQWLGNPKRSFRKVREEQREHKKTHISLGSYKRVTFPS